MNRKEDNILKYQGWIIYNGFLQANSFYDFAKMIQEAAQQKEHETMIYTNQDIISFLNKDVTINKQSLPDYVVFTDKDIYLARQLELMGIPVFNSSAAITTSDDKIKTYQLLAKVGITIPKTIFSPKTFGVVNAFTNDYLAEIMNSFSFPLVIKEAYGSFGEQVYLIHNKNELHKKVSEIGDRPFMFQELITSSYGKDIRLQVVGDQVVAAMKRTAKNDFRANVTSGGTMEPYKPTLEETQLAVKASQLIGADFSGVDLLFGETGPIVCEVNSNAHIRNIFDCTGINAAPFIIEHIEHILGEFK